MTHLVLSIFPGIDLLGEAFVLEGFCVVRGGDPALGQLGIEYFHPPANRFDGVIGGSPCKAFSRAVKGNKPSIGDLIPEFARVVMKAQPFWFLMENVPQAYTPPVEGYYIYEQVLNAKDFGSIQDRKRKFWFGCKAPINPFPYLEYPVLTHPPSLPTVTATEYKYGKGDKRRAGRAKGRRLTKAEICQAFDLPANFDIGYFSVQGFYQAIGNAVPLKLGRAVAKAIKTILKEVGYECTT